MKAIKYIAILFLIQISISTYSQDTPLVKYFDSFVYSGPTFTSITFQMPFDFIYHLPDEEDEKLYEANKHLIGQLPTEKNYATYMQLAAALWSLEKITEAETMFLNIVNSQLKSYTTTYYHSSDIPGDTTTNLYGYGSSTSNYKNTACIYLTKIYIEKKKFQTALSYLDQAVKKYKVTYTCGTGYNQQKNKYDFLYAACYEGLGYHKKNIDKLLPTCLDWDNQILVRAIKKTYSKAQIKNYLLKAEQSITCVVDTFLSSSWITTKNEFDKEKTDTSRYYSGSGTIILFNRKIDLPRPRLEDGEKVSGAYYVKLFKASSFYKDLIGRSKFEEDD